jgi:hypothetical protein
MASSINEISGTRIVVRHAWKENDAIVNEVSYYRALFLVVPPNHGRRYVAELEKVIEHSVGFVQLCCIRHGPVATEEILNPAMATPDTPLSIIQCRTFYESRSASILSHGGAGFGTALDAQPTEEETG